MNTSQLKKRTNAYGYEESRCPVCGDWKKTRNMGMHIAKMKDDRHFEYWFKNTTEKITRVWNN